MRISLISEHKLVMNLICSNSAFLEPRSARSSLPREMASSLGYDISVLPGSSLRSLLLSLDTLAMSVENGKYE